MTFAKIDDERHAALLSHGLGTQELKSFFRECRPKLLMANERVQNVPGTHMEALKRVVRFSEPGRKVFQEWLRSRKRQHSDETRHQLVPRFRAIEKEGVDFSPDELDELYRCGLDELYKPAPDPQWLAFLATPIPSRSVSEGATSASLPRETAVDEASPTSEEWIDYVMGIAGIDSGATNRNAILDIAMRIGRAVRGANAELLADIELPQDVKAVVSAIIQAALPNSRVTDRNSVELTVPVVRDFDPSCDYLSLEMIGVSGRSREGGPYFADIIAFVDGDEIFTLKESDIRLAVPQEGRIILYPDRGFLQPPEGTAVCYRAARIPTTKAVRVRAEKLGRTLYLIEYAPQSTSDPDALREWFVSRASRASGSPSLFVTTNKLVLKPKAESLQRLLAKDAEWDMDAWHVVRACDLSNGSYALAPLPLPSAKVDLSRIEVVARRLLRVAADRKALGLTRNQLKDLSEAVRDAEGAFGEESRATIASRLARMSEGADEYEALIEDLLRSDRIQRDIEVRVSGEVSKRANKQADERKALERLEAEKVALEKRLFGLRGEGERRAKEVRAAIHIAFESAKRKELDFLGQMALWQAVLGSNAEKSLVRGEVGDGSLVAPQSVTLPEVEFRDIDTERVQLADVFHRFGISEKSGTLLSKAVEAAVQCLVPIVVVGGGAASMAAMLMHCIVSGKYREVRIPVGLLSRARVDEVVFARGPSGILIRDANFSDISVYGSDVLETLLLRVCERSPDETRPIIFSGIAGPAALSWPAELQEIALKIELDSLERLVEDSMSCTATSPLQNRLLARLEDRVNVDAIDVDLELLQRLVVHRIAV